MPVRTLSDLFQHAVANHPRPDMFRARQSERYVDVPSQRADRRVRELSQGLVSLGVEPGDRVALLSENRLEWALADLAILGARAVVVPVYPTLLAEQIGYILNDSRPKVAFCSTPEQAAKLEEAMGEGSPIRHVVSFDRVDRAGVLPLAKVEELGRVDIQRHGDDYDERIAGADPQDLATLIYTSGTTGDPKGVMLTHDNIVQNVLSCLKVLDLNQRDSCLSFLPLSHIFERMAGYYTMMYAGVSIAYAESIDTVAQNMGEVRPTVMVSVPRLYEKIYARVLGAASAGGAVKRGIFFWAKAAGAQFAARKIAGRSPRPWLGIKMGLANALVFRKLRKRTGGRLRFFVSGGAPLAKEIAEFFYSAGLPILEGYGLTETSPVITVNTFENFRPGSVGKPIPGVEVKIADDGEILTRSLCVMKGYYGKEQASAEVLRDGWFHTGDIGRLDDDGFLYITDRKKDIIVTAGGKNIAPQPIENALKSNKYVAEVCLIGDKRKYLVALIVPNFENLEDYARRRGLEAADLHALLGNETVRSLYQHIVDKVNANHPSFEQVKYFTLLEHEFSLESGELTPTLKVKRRVIQRKYVDQIEAMYEVTTGV